MKCEFCTTICTNDWCSFYEEAKDKFFAESKNIAFMEYYDINYTDAVSEAYKDAYKAFCWAYETGVKVNKWINY